MRVGHRNQDAISGHLRRQAGSSIFELQGLMDIEDDNTDCDDDVIMEKTQESDLVHSQDDQSQIKHPDGESTALTIKDNNEIKANCVSKDLGLTSRDFDKDSDTNIKTKRCTTDDISLSIKCLQSNNESSDLGIRFQRKREDRLPSTMEVVTNENCQQNFSEKVVELDLADVPLSSSLERPKSLCLGIRNDKNDNTTVDRDLMNQADSIAVDLTDLVESTQDSPECDIDSEGDTCRICHCGNETEALISPCLCTGTVKYIHHSCLMDWLKRCVKTKCELCLQNFSVHRKTKPLKKWRRPDQKPTPIIWLLTFIVALTLNIASIAKDGSQKCVSNPCIIFYVVGALGAMLGFAFFYHWLMVSIRYMKQWMALNEEWTLIGSDNKILGNENLAASSKSIETKDEKNEVEVV